MEKGKKTVLIDMPCELSFKGETMPAPAGLARLVQTGCGLKARLNLIKAELDQVHADLYQMIREFITEDMNSLHILCGNIDCHVQEKRTDTIANPEKLRRILGPRFTDLVLEKVTYGLTKPLRAMAFMDDEVNDCIERKEGKPSISYEKKG